MDFGSFMAFTVLVGGIVSVFGIMMRGYRARLSLREREVELRIAEANARAQQNSGSDARIEQRLRVLERIATDKGSNLAAQIESLRDERARETEAQ